MFLTYIVPCYFCTSLTANNCFYNGQANDYMGKDTVTLYNDTCQRWETQNPHPHHYKVTDFPDQAWPENFCRATPDSHRPWCYTTNETNRFDYCDINNCSTYIKSSRAKASSDT